MSRITTHILDTAAGKPADAVPVILYSLQAGEWLEMADGITGKDGRIAALLAQNVMPANGLYKMKFFTKSYFEQLGVAPFYPYVEIVFEVRSSEHHHIPLLISPYGYTTYRGS